MAPEGWILPVDEQVLWTDHLLAPCRPGPIVGHELQRRFGPDRLLVWSASGTHYDPPASFAGQLVHLQFGGMLCPPLEMLQEACASIHSWLAADPSHVVAVHCKTGRGRSALLLCCALAQHAARAGATSATGGRPCSPLHWLSRLAALRRADENHLTLPSHRRYLFYFERLLRGEPAGPPLYFRSVVLHDFPALAAMPHITLSGQGRVLFSSRDVGGVLALPAGTGGGAGGGVGAPRPAVTSVTSVTYASAPERRCACSAGADWEGGGGAAGGGGGAGERSAGAGAPPPPLVSDVVLSVTEGEHGERRRAHPSHTRSYACAHHA